MGKWLRLITVVLLSLVVYSGGAVPQQPAPQERTIFSLRVVSCPEATACLMNIVGETGVLGRQVAVWVGNYQAPSANYSSCRLEKFKGERAASFLEETLRSAEYIHLVKAHKKSGSAYLTGILMVDGKDITVRMFEMQLAVPRGIKVNWCEKLSRKLEV